MTIAYNPHTQETAIVKDNKADKDGNITVIIDGVEQIVNYDNFVKAFNHLLEQQ